MINAYIENNDDYGLFNALYNEIKMNFTAIGNKNLKDEKTEWWEEAEEKYHDYLNEYLEEKEMKEIQKIDEETRTEREMIFEIAKQILKYDVKHKTIKGYCQRDWQDIYYEAKYEKDADYYEAIYFGMYKEISLKDEENDEYIESTIITDDNLWEAEKKGLKEELEKIFNQKIDNIYQFDGYIKTPKYKKVA